MFWTDQLSGLTFGNEWAIHPVLVAPHTNGEQSPTTDLPRYLDSYEDVQTPSPNSKITSSRPFLPLLTT